MQSGDVVATVPFEWHAVVVTCSTAQGALAIRQELIQLQKNGVFATSTSLLAIEDPEVGIGSGGATLNAILVAAEHLSAKRGFMVLNPDVFIGSNVLIFHNGRSYPYEPCGKAFIPTLLNSGASDVRTNLENLLSLVETLIPKIERRSSSGGVWVCSTDAVITFTSVTEDVLSDFSDCVLFAVPCDVAYARDHGVLHLEATPFESLNTRRRYAVKDIKYRRSIADLSCCKLSELSGRVPVVSGVVYFSPSFAESLLSLQSRAPIDSCTYLGLDSGSHALQVSLFFDILAAMAIDISAVAFAAGDCGKTYGAHRLQKEHSTAAMSQVRRMVWKELRKYTMEAVVLRNAEHLYWSEHLPFVWHLQIIKRCIPDANGLVPINGSLRFVDGGSETEPSRPSFIQNSILIGTDGNGISIGGGSFVSGTFLDTKLTSSAICIPSDSVLMSTHVKWPSSGSSATAVVFFGTHDELNVAVSDPKATFCNRPWGSFLRRSGIADSDIWETFLDDCDKTLFSAKLFPVYMNVVSIDLQNVLWFANDDAVETSDEIAKKWLSLDRISLRDVLTNVDYASEFAFRREVRISLAISEMRRVLCDGGQGSLSLVFARAVLEKWTDRLLNALDEMASDYDGDRWDPGRAARVLANIADLLGCLAAGLGGLRSGPAANRDWSHAFSILETGEVGSIRRGVVALREQRQNWMHSPQHLVRAARHYDGAAQILVRNAVSIAIKFVRVLPSGSLPAIGDWVTCECPARVDLFGGWTDTPPICYELGGSVVNASILLDGKRPIGAKVCRIATFNLELVSDDGSRLSIKLLDDLLDYNQPSAPGALVKACLLCTNIVKLGLGTTLAEQLREKFGSGFAIHTWSHLPRGSGLGTSSILSGAVLAALWFASGMVVDRLSIIHAVLCVEQMLTTGGGWQDQVGGLMGGVLHATSLPVLPVNVAVRRLPLFDTLTDRLRRHLVLVYTGKVRLAKNLLQNVLRNWYARDTKVYDTFQALYQQSFKCVDALTEGNLEEIGRLMNFYWQLKKVLAPGAEPILVQSMMERLRPHVYGQHLCGAGGGGYMVLLSREPDSQALIRSIIKELKGTEEVVVTEVAIDSAGLQLTIGDRKVDVV